MDAHGNLVTGDVDDVDFTEGEMRPVADEERVRLTSEADTHGEFEEVIKKNIALSIGRPEKLTCSVYVDDVEEWRIAGAIFG